MSAECSLPAAADSVRLARRFVVDTLPGLPQPRLDELVLMVSELTTNCIEHAESGFHLTVQRTGTDIRVEVTDSGGGSPAIRRPATTEAHGRGLRIVSELSDQWGVVRFADRIGKTVWFTVSIA